MYIHSHGRRIIAILVFFSILFFCSVLFYAIEEEPKILSALSPQITDDILFDVSINDHHNLLKNYYSANTLLELSSARELFLIDWGREGENLGWGPFHPVNSYENPLFSLEVYDYEEYDGTLESREGVELTYACEEGIDVEEGLLEQEMYQEEEEEREREMVEDVLEEHLSIVHTVDEEDPVEVVHYRELVDLVDVVEMVEVVNVQVKEMFIQQHEEIEEEEVDVAIVDIEEEIHAVDVVREDEKIEEEKIKEEEVKEEVDVAIVDIKEEIHVVEVVSEKEEREEREEVVEVVEKEQSSTYDLFTHQVSAGDTLWSIAEEYDIDVDTIIGTNPQLHNANQLSIGQNIHILSEKGIMHEVYRGETLWEIARSYDLTVEKIVQANQMGADDIIREGDNLFIPGVSATQRSVRYMWPVNGPISSYFGPRWGRMHEGIDIAVPIGTPVKATRSGRVTISGWVGAYGYAVYIDHGDGVSSRYAHNSRLLVRPGEYVNQGQTIALSGSTGQSTGPHVHFEIRERDRPINPLNYLQR